tara:strand:- start:3558 stop:3935 length:378 start_codon:yes stop_codon:yes gene_type:complete
MSLEKKEKRNKMSRSNYRKIQRIRNKLKKVNKDRFRLTIYRSSKNISAQIIDDKNNKTLVSASSVEKKVIGSIKKSDLSNTIAQLLAKRALEKKIKNVYFDRGRYKFHGRIKSFAETLRKNGVVF